MNKLVSLLNNLQTGELLHAFATPWGLPISHI